MDLEQPLRLGVGRVRAGRKALLATLFTLMKRKTTLAIALIAALIGATAAFAGPVNVAKYQFKSKGEVLAFVKASSGNCAKKWRSDQTMSIKAEGATKMCAYRSGVLGDATDAAPDQEVAAQAALLGSTPEKKRSRIYVGAGVRFSNNAGYQFRVYPTRKAWQLVKDAKGSAGATVLANGTSKEIIPKIGAVNYILIRAFDLGQPETTIKVGVNGKFLHTYVDSTSTQADGRKTVVMVGAKSGNAGDAVARFDRVSIRVPFPFK